MADVVVVGAGPVGCVTALAHARRGARVVLLDAGGDVGDRFAGELLHPTAVRSLHEVGVTSIPPAEGHGPVRGFAVLSPRPSAPSILDYPSRPGATFHFPAFLAYLREVAASHPCISLRSRCKALSVDAQKLTYEDRSTATPAIRTIDAGLIVAADGRFSTLRKSLVPDEGKVTLSSMAGLLLRGVKLPHEGYGHVVLARIGPALVYRVSPDEVRVCLDVPTPWRRAADRTRRLAEAYGEVLPPDLAAAVRAELEADRVSWAINAVAPRTCYGRPGLALVGDAVGHFHPMTAVGMTLGFGDAVALARHGGDLAAYEAERRRESESPALLATALYEIFSLQSEPTAACREAILHLWRDPHLRRRTMSFLACEDTDVWRLVAVGLRFVARASIGIAAKGAARGELGSSFEGIRSIAGLVHWLVNDSVPAPMRLPFVQRAATPFELLRHRQTARLGSEAGLET